MDGQTVTVRGLYGNFSKETKQLGDGEAREMADKQTE
jgi:hypothetical protein